ncbi:MAG: hybrid sensor histidine kinase/response regulator [Bacteriovorax sp.]|jgi:two-component system chemotaxis sensor kinase CheA
MDEFLQDFLVECFESLSAIDQGLVALERKPDDVEVLNNIFRAVHTVKGTCGMFGFQRLERIAHVTEDVLGKMREGKLEATPAVIGPILASIDIIRSIVEGIEAKKAEPEGDDSAAIEKLKSLLNGNEIKAPEVIHKIVTHDEETAAVVHESKSKLSVTEQTLRVNIDVLDGLMNFVGELVLTRNQLVQLVRGDDESKYQGPIQLLNRVTSGLQEAVMKTRMQPIGNAWGKLPRIVRDLSQSTGKEIELIMNGQETEIDRQILQAIQDPLIHCVRNSADHGIELPEIRKQKGKPSVGTITLNAFHEGGHIVIEIKDNGAGINFQAVCEKAIERDLVKREVASQLSNAQIARFIFEPGFSTAKQITEVSGRGVGMDVVRSNVEKIGGSIDLPCEEGAVGTTIRIKIPLTLAIVSALIVKAGGTTGDVFAIPQVGVLELVRISESNQHLIEDIHGSKVLRLRDKLLPLINMAKILGMENSNIQSESSAIANMGEIAIIIAQVGDTEFGFWVDEIFDTQEIVVKPVGRLLRDIKMFAGSTILGDGRVVLILDTGRIAAKALLKTTFEAATHQEIETESTEGENTTVLVFKGNDHAPLAVPLALVSRLEEFSPGKIEKVDNRYVVQYRGALLPLIPCQASVTLDPKSEQNISAIIFSDGRRSMGLVVSQIVDIVEEVLSIDSTGKKSGVLGAAIVAGYATEIIDTYYFLQTAYPDWFVGKKTMSGSVSPKILLVDDSHFFRDLLRPILESKGYVVTLAFDGSQALHMLEKSAPFDLILSDIEMPVMNGLVLAAKVKEHPVWKNTPILALTSLASPPDKQRGLDAGFLDYLTKFDQDAVLLAIHSAISKNKKEYEAGTQLNER